jgi:hypothetical protein
LADDLLHWQGRELEKLPTPAPTLLTTGSSPSSSPSLPAADRDFDERQAVKVVPKGLRSFDAHDAAFFLELVPGARDRDGLPDSIRFWKTRIEEPDPDQTFRVGLIFPTFRTMTSQLCPHFATRLTEWRFLRLTGFAP